MIFACYRYFEHMQKKLVFALKANFICLCILFCTCTPIQAESNSLSTLLYATFARIWPEKAEIQSERFVLREKPKGAYDIYYQVEQEGIVQKATVENIRLLNKSKQGEYYLYHNTQEKGLEKKFIVVDAHLIRSKQQVLLFILDTQGKINEIETLLFWEPKRYKAPLRWQKQLYQQDFRPIQASTIAKRVDALTGATMTRSAFIYSSTRALFLHRFLLKQGQLSN